MTDQQNFEATRPASADPAVALAQALGQLPKTPPAKAAPSAKAGIFAKTSVEALAGELGLKLGDQNELTIRRIKRGKNYSFVRANGTPIRHVGTIRRLNRMAVPPAYRKSATHPIRPRICRRWAATRRAGCNTATMPIGKRFANSARRIGWPGWSRRCRKFGATSLRICPASADPRIRAVGGDRTDRAHRDPPGQ